MLNIRYICTKPFFKKCKILPLDLNLQLNSGKTLWKAANSLLCSSLDPIFKYRGESLTFFTPFKRLDISQASLPYAGVRAWNTIPRDIRSSPSLSCFKTNLKKHLLSLLWAHGHPKIVLSGTVHYFSPLFPLSELQNTISTKCELHVTNTHHCYISLKKKTLGC